MCACKVRRITFLRKTYRGRGASSHFGTRATRACRTTAELLLLVLLAILQLLELPRRNHLRRFHPLPRIPHKSSESQGQLFDPFRLPPFDGLRRNQLAADADRRSPSQNIAPRRLLVHPSRGYQRNLRQRGLHRADVAISADIDARKHFHEIRSRLPSLDDFARRQRTRNRRDIISHRELDNLQALPRARQKSRSRVQSFLRKLNR